LLTGDGQDKERTIAWSIYTVLLLHECVVVGVLLRGEE
jgi:hypothetical protein